MEEEQLAALALAVAEVESLADLEVQAEAMVERPEQMEKGHEGF